MLAVWWVVYVRQRRLGLDAAFCPVRDNGSVHVIWKRARRYGTAIIERFVFPVYIAESEG